MKIIMVEQEVEYIKEKISDILHLWAYDIIEVSNDSGATFSMSKETFMKELEEELMK